MKKVSIFLLIASFSFLPAAAEKLVREIPFSPPSGSRIMMLYEQEGHIIWTTMEYPDDFTRTVERVHVDGVMYGPFRQYGFHGFTPEGDLPVFSVTEKTGRYFQIGSRRIEVPGSTEALAFGADSRTFACVSRADAAWYVHTPTGVYGPYDEVPEYGRPRFLSDGKTAVFIARQDGAFFLNAGGRVSGPWGGIWEPYFSPDGKRFAVPVEDGSAQYLVTESETTGPYDLLVDLDYSPDGKTLAYTVQEKGMYHVRFGAERRGPYDSAGVPGFSADGRIVTYAAALEGKTWLYSGKTRIGPYEAVGTFLNAGDGTLAWTARLKGKWHVFSRNGSWGPFEEVEDLRLLPDGKTPVFSARLTGAWYLYAGKDRYGPFDEPAGSIVLKDREKPSFCAFSGGSKFFYNRGVRTGPYEELVLVQPLEGEKRAAERPPVWAARTGAYWAFLAGKQKMGPFDRSGSAWDFSSTRDGKTWVCCAEIEGAWFLMRGTARVSGFENPGETEISPDGSVISLRHEIMNHYAGILIRGGRQYPGSFTRDRNGAVNGYLLHEKGKVKVFRY